jgi:glycosyltransferase involved in cell wall biosynthesis
MTMHVAINGFFWDRPDTGSGQYLVQLTRHLLQGEPELQVTILYPDLGRKPNLTLSHRCSWRPVAARTGDLGKVLFEQVGFPRACRRLGADLIHVPYWGSPLRSPAPTVVTVHDLIPLVLRDYRGGPLARLYTSLVAAAARGAQHVITDSYASKADVVARLSIPAGRVTTVHLAAGERFEPGPADPAVLARYSLPEGYVLYLGGFDLRKNVTGLLHAYSFVGPAIGDRHPLVLAGRLPHDVSRRFPDIQGLIDQLEVSDWVRVTGFVDEADKLAIYRAAVAVVQVSRYEGFGLTALEAMACGKPVVVSDRSSLPEVVGPAGFAVDPDDIRGIAGAIIACAIQDDLREELGQRALVQAARFSWTRAARQTLGVYRQVLGLPLSGDAPAA